MTAIQQEFIPLDKDKYSIQKLLRGKNLAEKKLARLNKAIGDLMQTRDYHLMTIDLFKEKIENTSENTFNKNF